MPANLSLRELAEERNVLDLFLEETEGEETQEIAELLEYVKDLTEEKIERWGLWLVRQQQNVATIKAEEERLAGRRKTLENAIARSKARLQWELEQRGLEKVKRPLCTVRIQNNPPSLKGELDQAALDALYRGPGPLMDAVKLIPAKLELDRRAVLAVAKQDPDALPAGLEIVQTRSLRLA